MAFVENKTFDLNYILDLARCYSIPQIAKMKGMPEAEIIYSAFQKDSKLRKKFASARSAYYRQLREDIAERRDEKDILALISRKLRIWRRDTSTLLPELPAYDLSVLSDEELEQMRKLSRRMQGLSDDPAI